tara:strand:- start:3338 stop:3658 length:321 start_codon:yes stop_codon:yes gene_type:complete
MLLGLGIYLGLGIMHQIVEYKVYWSYHNWDYERSVILELNNKSGNYFKDQDIEEILQKHSFEIKMMLLWATAYWPLTVGRYFIKKGSDLDITTRTGMLRALFETLK